MSPELRQPLDPFPGLTTERLQLRELTARDALSIRDMLSDPEVTRYHDLPTIETPHEALRFVAEMLHRRINRQGIRWALVSKADQHFVGSIGLNHIFAPARRASLGYELKKSSWGHGYATEAVRAVVDFAHGSLGLHRLEASVVPENAASLRVLEKSGFQREGLLRALGFFRGQFQDLVVLSRLSTDGRAPHSAAPER